MAISDFTGKNIQDTYQRVVQTDGTNLANGTGSLLPISFNGNDVIISGSLTAQTYIVSESIVNVTSGSTIFGNSSDDTHQLTGSLLISGSTSRISTGEYNVGVDAIAANTLFITGSGLIIETDDNDQNRHAMVKIGDVELIDLNTSVSTNEFLIHNVATLKITSGSDGGDVANTTNEIFVHNGHEFFICKGGEQTSDATIKSTGTITSLTDSTVRIDATNCSIKALNDTPSYIMGFEANPNSTPQIVKSIEAANIFPALGGAITASAVSASGEIIGTINGGTF
jgi:hypothetical protein